MTALVRVPFHGDEIECLRDGDDVWVSIAQASANLGVDDNTQVRKLRQKAWAVVVMKPTTDSRGIERETWCLHLDSVEDIHAIASIAAREAVAAYRQGAEEARLLDASIGDSGHRFVRTVITEAAVATTGCRKGKTYKSVRSGLEADLKASLGWSGTGRTWALFPASRWPDLRARLDEIKRAALRAAPSVQPVLDFAKKTGAAE